MNTRSIIDILCESGTLDLELHTAYVDSMPHVMWLLKSGDTYVANGTAHNRQIADKEIAQKLKVLGSTLGKTEDFTEKK